MRGKSVLLGVLSVAAASLTPAASSGAATIRLHAIAIGPAAWKDGSVLVPVAAGSGFALREVDPANGDSGTVATFAHAPGQVEVEASSAFMTVQRLAYAQSEPFCKEDCLGVGEDLLLAGSSAGSLRCVFNVQDTPCLGTRSCAMLYAAPVSESELAYQPCPNMFGEELGSVVVDESSNPPVTTLITQVSLPEAIAGPWLVGLAPGWTHDYNVNSPLPPCRRCSSSATSARAPNRYASPCLLVPGAHRTSISTATTPPSRAFRMMAPSSTRSSKPDSADCGVPLRPHRFRVSSESVPGRKPCSEGRNRRACCCAKGASGCR
jgi:hypothetical protein